MIGSQSFLQSKELEGKVGTILTTDDFLFDPNLWAWPPRLHIVISNDPFCHKHTSSPGNRSLLLNSPLSNGKDHITEDREHSSGLISQVSYIAFNY